MRLHRARSPGFFTRAQHASIPGWGFGVVFDALAVG
jgi:hypothetical protein